MISKITANRLSDVLPSIIDLVQSTFIKVKNVLENIRLAQELLKSYSTKWISLRCTFKIHIRKANDTISWDFLHQVFIGFGFLTWFSSWIVECVTTTSYSLKINGDLVSFFKAKKRGLKQGKSIAAFLFVICMVYVSWSLKSATKESSICTLSANILR